MKLQLLLISILFLAISGCGSKEANTDIASCEKQVAEGTMFLYSNNEREKIVECMKGKGWKPDFMTGSKWWQSTKFALDSSSYSK